MEAKHEQIVVLLHTEMPVSQIIKEVETSLSTIYSQKKFKRTRKPSVFTGQ